MIIQNAGQIKTTKTDGRTLLSKAVNVPLRDVVDVTGSDQSTVTGVGFAVIVDSDQLPANSFFKPDRVFPVRVQHSRFPGE